MKFFALTIALILLCSIEANQALPLLKQRAVPLEPINYYLNSAFDVIQNPYYFFQENHVKKHKTLFKRIGSPIHSVNKDGGIGKLFRDEFTTTRVIPNIGLHATGGAYDKLYLYQYFKNQNVHYPLLATALLSYMGHFGNEALELTNSKITSHDNLADLLFFDLASFFIAFNPKAMNFLVKDMNMMAWHLQPMYDLETEDITNAGLNYIFRPDLFNSRLKPFLFIGMQNMAGLSYELQAKEFITLSAGMALTDPLEQKGRFVTSIFYDKNDSLYSSIYINGTEDYRIRLNLYPELFRFKKIKLGLLLGEKKGHDYVSGININLPFGLSHTF